MSDATGRAGKTVAGRPAMASWPELIAAARTAVTSGDYQAALTTWATVRQRFPKRKIGFLGAVAAAKAAGKLDLALELATEGAAKFPEAERFAKLRENLAKAAKRNQRRTEAPASWESLSPEEALGYALGPVSIRNYSKADVAAALQRLDLVMRLHPAFEDVYVERASLLRRTGQIEAAYEQALAAQQIFPQSRPLLLLEAGTLNDQGKHEVARARLAGRRDAGTTSPTIEAAYSATLSRLERFEEAESVCARALSKWPKSPDLLAEYASLASRRGDWDAALARWQGGVELLPANPKLRRGLESVRMQLASQQLPGSELHTGETGKMFAQFESLGGTMGGCEFGMVQRQAGSISLGLLRWSNITAEKLILGLQTNFHGLGTPENTTLSLLRVSPTREEYVVVDKNYRLGSHTFVATTEAPEDKMLAQTVRRLAYLRDKLIEELGQAQKIFVYKFDLPPEPGVMQAIFAAAQQHGPNRLLFVCKADAENPPSQIKRLDRGLYVGFVAHLMRDVAGNVAAFDHAGWTAICQAMLDACAADAATGPTNGALVPAGGAAAAPVDAQDILARVAAILRELLLDDELEVTRATWADDVVGWSSFTLVEIILACQEQFGVRIAAEAADALHSVGDLVDTIQRGLQPAGG